MHTLVMGVSVTELLEAQLERESRKRFKVKVMLRC